MDACEKFLKKLEESLPELCYTNDLIKAGIYVSKQAAAFARRNRTGPSYFHVSNKAVYLREAVIEWLRKNMRAS